jgi:molybdopterin-guanine dinucleotide biosynthesis protein A
MADPAEPTQQMALDRAQITGVVLAGGRGSRMEGRDKGLELFEGEPLALRAQRRLQKQVGRTMLNANRHLDRYRAFGVPVHPDRLPNHPGPLAGFAAALRHCQTPYLVTVPCDTPFFPTDLVQRLAQGLTQEHAQLAVAACHSATPDGDPVWHIQPVFCLMHVGLLDSLEEYIAAGAARVEAWTTQHVCATVRFDLPQAFLNVNTLAQLRALDP